MDDLTIQSVTQTAFGTVVLDTHGRLYQLLLGDGGYWTLRRMPCAVEDAPVEAD